MTESQRLALISNAVANATKVAPQFQGLLEELKAEKLAEDLVLNHGLLEASDEDVKEEFVSLDAVESDKEDADFEEFLQNLEEVYSKLGRPAKPEDYKYSFSEEEIDQTQLKNFNETAHRIGLLPKQAERIIKFYNEMNEQQQSDQTKVFEAKQAEAMTDLKKEFGPTYTKRLDQAKKLAVETLGSEMLNNTIMKDGSRLGDNVQVIKAFSMLADKLSEDEIIKGEGTGYVTAKEIENEISELTEDGSPYWNKTHPNHQKTVDQVFKLREQLNG